MKFNPPFPLGHLNPILSVAGWQESDIMDIREVLVAEIKRQNEAEHGY